MVTIPITVMAFITILISMEVVFGMDLGMDMPTIIPTVDHLIASITTEGLMPLETALTAPLIEVKQQLVGDLKSILVRFKERTTRPLTLHLKTGTPDNQEQQTQRSHCLILFNKEGQRVYVKHKTSMIQKTV